MDVPSGYMIYKSAMIGDDHKTDYRAAGMGGKVLLAFHEVKCIHQSFIYVSWKKTQNYTIIQ